jgi:hypothetical protein
MLIAFYCGAKSKEGDKSMKRFFWAFCLAALIFLIGCESSQRKSDCYKQRVMDDFEKWEGPRVDQNIRMGRHPYEGVFNAGGGFRPAK